MKFNDEMKKRVIELRESGVGRYRMAKELGVSPSTAARWIKECGFTEPLKNEEIKTRVIICKSCGEEKETRSMKAKFCSEGCRARYNREHRGHERTCAWCKDKYYIYREKKYCSIDCMQKHIEWRKPVRDLSRILNSLKECECCRKIIIGSRKYCSDECSYRNRRALIKSTKPIYNKSCLECGQPYNTIKKNRKYCCEECGRKRENRVKYLRRRKVITRNGSVDWDITLKGLIARDEGICYLCGDEVDCEVHYNDNHYPSIDHVVPISKGGTHTWGNIKLAHRICNSIKSDSLESELIESR